MRLWCARRSLLTQEGICLQLRPDFHFLEVAYPYVARRLLTDEDPALRERLFQVPPPSLQHSSPCLVLFLSLPPMCIFPRINLTGLGVIFPKFWGCSPSIKC